jgi:hypothetical protein
VELTVTINGKRWKLRFVDASELPRGKGGLCDPPDAKGKTIRIWEGYLKPGKRRLLIHRLAHEWAHASRWHEDEGFVEESSGDLANILDKLMAMGVIK